MAGSGSHPSPTGSLTYRPDHPVDPTFALVWAKTRVRRQGVDWWTTRTPGGNATVAFRVGPDGVRADAWGPGTDWALTRLPTLLGADDDLSSFEAHHPEVAALSARFSSIRIGATGRWYESLLSTIIGQRVVTADAAASVRGLRRFGEPAAAGPIDHLPAPEVLLTITDHDFHRAGIDRGRARTLRVAAKYADRLERLDGLPSGEAVEWLQRLPGIGPWTAGITAGVAGGDADAVPVGDLHLPRIVTRALTGTDGDDQRMLEVLEPYAGHRGRVVRMAKMGRADVHDHRPKPFRYDISRI